LGDTNTTIYQTPTTKGLNTSLDDFIRSLGIDEKREVRADMLAIHIMLGNAELCGSDIEELATSSVGAMVTLLAVGLFSANSIKESSSDYPSSSTRFHSLLAFCESLLLVNTANSLKSGNLIMANIEKSMLARQRMDSVAKIFIEVEDFFNEDG
jgi:hypothetical protein